MGESALAFYHLALGFIHILTRKDYPIVNEQELIYIDSFKRLLLLLSTLFLQTVAYKNIKNMRNNRYLWKVSFKYP